MTNIIKLPERKEGDLFSYFESDVYGIEVGSTEQEIVISSKGDNTAYLDCFNAGGSWNRETLAQVLWAAAYYLDSEKRYMPEGDLIGINYEDET